MTEANVPSGTAQESDDALLERNGIVRVRADQFHVDGFRYTNLEDAIAQVRRASSGRHGQEQNLGDR